MAYEVTAAQYRDEWIESFQRGETYLKECVTREVINEGHSSAVFAVGGVSSGMTSRGANGLIPTRNVTDSQITFTLKERHSLENRTDFDVFTSQSGGLRKRMQQQSRKDSVIEIDDEIVSALDTATTQWNAGGAISPTLGVVTDIMSDLWENNADAGLCFLWTPKSWAKVKQLATFNSIDYVDKKPLMGDAVAPVMWNGATHIMHNGLPESGTATARNYAFSKAAIGHCLAGGEADVSSGFNDEHKYSWDRATIYHVAGILQQPGVIRITTDDTAAIA